MIQDFRKSIDFLINEIEGGYVNAKSDRGGETKYGISKRSYPDLDIANLTKENAERIYKLDFWTPCECDNVPFPLAYAIFDCAVNSGVPRSIRMLQKACNKFGNSLKVDGDFGPKTMNAVKQINAYQLSNVVISKRIEFFTRYVKIHPDQKVNLSGWMNRIAKVMSFVATNI